VGPGTSGSSPPPPVGEVVAHAEQAMGTVFSFTVHTGTTPASRAREAVGDACTLLHRLDGVFSTWDPRSPMSRLRRGELAPAEAPSEVGHVLELCRTAKELSGGWFDPWAMPGGIDPTGLVKGWAIERALDVVRASGVPAALLNGGGDIAAHGEPGPGQPWRIGIRHPWRVDALACIVVVRRSVATSGSYERGPHLVDPHSGRAVQAAASATVTGPSLDMADALATALAVGGDDVLARLAGLEGYDGYLIRAEGTEASTPDMAFADD
jgi:thiamine biosynthesis lipoprotein